MPTDDPAEQESDPVTTTAEETTTDEQRDVPIPPLAPPPAESANEPRPVAPLVPRRSDPAADLEPTAAFKERVQAMMQAVPQPNEETSTPPVDAHDARAQTRDLAWRNSVAAAQLVDKAQWTLDRLERDLHPVALRAYVDALAADMRSAAKLNLVLAGTIGPGKTSAALAAGRYAVERGLFTRVVRHKHYVKWLQHPDKAPGDLKSWQIEKRYRDVDLLILDDLGAGLDSGAEASRHARAETMSLIEDRIDSGKATLITTNLKAEVRNDQGELVGGVAFVLEERVLSRLSERGAVLTCTGPDRRERLSW